MAKSTKTVAGTQENTNIQQCHDTAPNEKPSGSQMTKNVEPQYSITDISNAAIMRFKVQPELVTAALKTVGKQRMTLAEAQHTIEEFMKREVK